MSKLRTLKVLIVVDVQNCFISGGFLGDTYNNESLKLSIKQKKEIENLINVNKLIIFTRDYHPQHHSSFTESNGRFPVHCRNLENKCENKNKNKNTIDKQNNSNNINFNEFLMKQFEKEYKKIFPKYNYQSEQIKNFKIIGTDLSYIFTIGKYKDVFENLRTV